MLALPALGDQTQPHTIAVMGEAELRVTPDFATIDVGVITQGTIVADTLADNSSKMSRVIDALRSLNITDNDIHTSTFMIQPKFEKRPAGDYDDQEMRAVVGYYISNKVTVTVTDVSKISKIIDAAAQAGANVTGEVDFQVKNLTQHMDMAREAAVESAHHKAEILTLAAHLKLGSAVSITDNQSSTEYNARAGGSQFETVVVTGSRMPTPILPGEITLTSEVTIVYQAR